MAVPTPEEWRVLSALLDEALDLPSDERAPWLARQAAVHPTLVDRLSALLADREAASRDGFLEGVAVPPPVTGGRPGVRCGPYVLEALIGRGGMGSVWSARRIDGRYEAKVAVKLLTTSLVSHDSERRFRREGQILARLRHPNIAQLLDAGVTDDGQPFLVLELVDGQHLDAFARAGALDVRARVRLFLDVLAAVAHAHSNLVVHRDLKPSNILVDGDGCVKLLDFGIAKLMDADEGAPAATALTRAGAQVLTPLYASPEQVTGGEVTTATDVYALGVVLFELLTESRPYRLKQDSRGALDEAIVTGDPLRPSDATPDALRKRRLRGDLDTIVLKALRKEPTARYATVRELGEDLERWLDGRPVRARPDAFGYRASRFVRRHALGVATAAVVLLAVAGGATAALWQAQVARAEQQRAEEITTFITNIFRNADPYQRTEAAVTAPALLTGAYQRVDDDFGTRPELRFELTWLIGSSLASLQAFDDAEPILQSAAAQARTLFAPDDERRLRAETALGGLYRFRGRLDDMDSLVTGSLAQLRAMKSPPLETLVSTLLDSAHLAIDRGAPAAAVQPAREADALATRALDPESEQRVSAAQVLTVALEMAGAPIDELLREADRALALTTAYYGGEVTHPRVVEGQLLLGRALGAANRTEEAIAALEVADTNSALGMGVDNYTRAFIKGAIGRQLLLREQYADAAAAYGATVRILRANGDSVSPNFALARGSEGQSRFAMRQHAEARVSLGHAVELLRAAWGPDHVRVRHFEVRLARAEVATGARATARARLAPIVADSTSLPDGVREELRRALAELEGRAATSP